MTAWLTKKLSGSSHRMRHMLVCQTSFYIINGIHTVPRDNLLGENLRTLHVREGHNTLTILWLIGSTAKGNSQS